MGVGLRQGLKIGELWVGSIFADTLSGVQVAVGPGEIGFAELATDAVSGTVISNGGIGTVAKIFAGVLDGDTNVLSSGSKWVAFRQAFAAPPFVTATLLSDGRAANGTVDGDWIAIANGSGGIGSFLALGSPGGRNFNWLAIGSR